MVPISLHRIKAERHIDVRLARMCVYVRGEVGNSIPDSIRTAVNE